MSDVMSDDRRGGPTCSLRDTRRVSRRSFSGYEFMEEKALRYARDLAMAIVHDFVSVASSRERRMKWRHSERL